MTDFRAIAAVAENGVIGCEGTLPWNLPEDLAWFRAQTLGQVIVVGRKTFQSFRKPLPQRHTVVLSLTLEPSNSYEVVRSAEAVVGYKTDKTIWICGGAAIYETFLPVCTELILTHVHKEVEGDTYFPKFLHLFKKDATLKETSEFTVVRYLRDFK